MRATGIVRRIDDLGRVVIPREIRRTMRIREGDPLEIFTDKDGSITFKKYSILGDMSDMVGTVMKTLDIVLNRPIAITDRDTVTNATGKSARNIVNKYISHELAELLNERSEKLSCSIPICENMNNVQVVCFFPIISEGEVIGSIAILENDLKLTKTEIEIIRTMAIYIGKELEN